MSTVQPNYLQDRSKVSRRVVVTEKGLLNSEHLLSRIKERLNCLYYTRQGRLRLSSQIVIANPIEEDLFSISVQPIQSYNTALASHHFKERDIWVKVFFLSQWTSIVFA